MDGHELYRELISGKLDGVLTPEQEARLSRHLASCDECRELYDILSGAHEALGAELEPPAELLSNVMAGVRRENRARRRSKRRRAAAAAGFLAAAAVLAVVIFPGGARSKDADMNYFGFTDETPSVYAPEAPGAQIPRESENAPQAPAGSSSPASDAAESGSGGSVPAALTDPEAEAPVMPAPGSAAPDEPDEPTDPGDLSPDEPASNGSEEISEPEDDELVVVTDYIPDIYVDLKYATEDNFTGQVIYDFTQARLRYGTVKKLEAVMEELRGEGYSLLIWDALRPVSAQYALWEVCPDARYVANPNNKGSGHSRGNTVDLTLVYADGFEVEMPSGFDEFSALADRDYSDVSRAAGENAGYLESVMTAHGFKPYSAEWWHYTDTDDYPVVD